jgi:uncharacterized protein YgfB (UPF0149 family)
VTLNPANTPLEYETLRHELVHAGAVVSLAELHGGLCAALCAGGPVAADQWLADCLIDQELSSEADLDAPLRELLNVSWRMLDGDGPAFAPLLPDDDAPLEEQVQAVALWCHGFLGGLGTTAPDVGRAQPAPTSDTASSTVTEILADFVEISRAGLSEEEAAGEDQPDFALAEIVEHVRVSAQLLFEELAEHRARVGTTH